jgi:hypothetical protein
MTRSGLVVLNPRTSRRAGAGMFRGVFDAIGAEALELDEFRVLMAIASP